MGSTSDLASIVTDMSALIGDPAELVDNGRDLRIEARDDPSTVSFKSGLAFGYVASSAVDQPETLYVRSTLRKNSELFSRFIVARSREASGLRSRAT
jgi:hypothetical protein